MTFRLVTARSAGRTMAEELPESVAAAALEFITGPLLDDPFRVGKPLRPPLEGTWVARRGQYRVLYRINAAMNTVTVLQVTHRLLG